ncbi:MAG TPA: hypothetical protein VN706_17560 [Gemmatimonadaceae bacterium]|nr:hypothetical protein [Gemmatimonadaceae bacterium]
MKTLITLALAGLFVAPIGAVHSQSGPDTVAVRTVQLHHLTNSDAVALLTPYMLGRGGVYTAGQGIHAVTLRGSARTIAEMEKLLAQYDRSPTTVTLSFQLVSGDYTNRRDPVLASLDSVLRTVLRFSGYHLISTALINASERSSTTQTLSADGQDYELSTTVEEISGEGADATIHLKVYLQETAHAGMTHNIILSTGVTIPMGHTVVLGTSVQTARAQVPLGYKPQPNGGTVEQLPPASQYAAGSDRALILVVRPQLAAAKRD